MADKKKKTENEQQLDFVVETIKKRPINPTKLARKTIFTAMMAVVFGGVACLTFLLLEPLFSKMLSPKDVAVVPEVVSFPEDTTSEEKSPEEMLAEYMQQENQNQQDGMDGESVMTIDPVEIPLSDDQVKSILSQVTFDKSSYRQMYLALTSYVREISQSIVTVSAISSDVDWMNNIQENEKTISGVIIAENNVDLLILVDASILTGANELVVNFYDNSYVNAEIVAIDHETGLAVIGTPLATLPPVIRSTLPIATLGSSNTIGVGAPVIAVGSTMGQPGSIGYGIIASTRTTLSNVDTAPDVIQTDIACSNNASGILFNMQKQVIGIVKNGVSNSDVNNLLAAYGISNLKHRIEKMSNRDPLCYLGITSTSIAERVHISQGVPYGAYVLKTDMDSPAMLAGIQTGDIVTKIGENSISSSLGYANTLQDYKVGDKIKLTFMRQVQDEYKEMVVELTIEEAK